MELKDFNLSTIKFNHAVKYNNGFYINIFDNHFDKIILQTPKLKIGYSCSSPNNSNISISKPGTYTQPHIYKNKSYYYTAYVTDDLNAVITDFEELCITHLKKIKVALGIKNFTFNSSLNDSTDNIFIRIKLITDKDANILTLINLSTRESVDISYIKTDNHAVQYIEFNGLSITNDGNVYPVITAHQIVIYPNYKIYKKKMLLDVLLKASPEDINISGSNIKHNKVDTNGTGNGTGNPTVTPKILKLDPTMLLSMRGKLKPV